MYRYTTPVERGLHDLRFEHDSCGVGFVAHINGVKSRDLVEKGLGILRRLAHRGATGWDPSTGDGSGILIQMPHEFLRSASYAAGISLPQEGNYGTGLVFLPRESPARHQCEQMLERILTEERQILLGWRDVPVDSDALGEVARLDEPLIRQIFIARGPEVVEPIQFERKLYVIRKRAEREAREVDLPGMDSFCISSLSCRTLVYKGLLLSDQMDKYYLDLADPSLASGLALVHQRYSTNTFPRWDLAQPFHCIGHNGEINTLRGNVNWMQAREALFLSSVFGSDITKILPVIRPGGSDSACLDNVIEMLTLAGRPLAHVMMMLIPEAWEKDEQMDPDKRAFYEYHAGMIEPWDGPAAVAFTDGIQIGATLDRNGLRPARYVISSDGLVVMASEVGVVDIPPEKVVAKGRLQPGKMILIDTAEGRFYGDEEVKQSIVTKRPYREWVEQNKIELSDLPDSLSVYQPVPDTIRIRQQIFGFTQEDLRFLMIPMATEGKEPVGSMGNDTPLAVLSSKPQLLYNYFKQLFAQVTNPPIDPIREEMVMSLDDYIGREGNLLEETAEQIHQLRIPHPILTNEEMQKIRYISQGDLKSITFQMLFRIDGGVDSLRNALDDLCQRATRAVMNDHNVIILSDRGVNRDLAAIPNLLAISAVHHHLIREGLRTKVALTIESGEAREVHQFALLIGYGASAINPYLALETLSDLAQRGQLPPEVNHAVAENNYIKAVNAGLLKIFSKMGISTLRSYRGAQIFEAVGLSAELIDQYFTGTPSRISGIGLAEIATEVSNRHRKAFPRVQVGEPVLEAGGKYAWRRSGEHHILGPDTIADLQQAVRKKSAMAFKRYSSRINDQSRQLATLRGLFELRSGGESVPLEEVESAEAIAKRFVTGAMSFGSLSAEAHETLAVAMNRVGGQSNSGEGGEDPARYTPDPDGSNRNSSVKQVASGRFGVNSSYLVSGNELQIKIAQGAKPGEGGQLPGHKVNEVIAKTRFSTPGVTLISPPPHHDIYSIEDLKQLIFDLKCSNPKARISVKLVSEVGVGTVAAGVSKARADMVLISGGDGGTGASPLSSIMHAGLPWELGLADTQQTLVNNNLRGRIRVQVDGQLRTGRDIVIGALLGAEEFGFGTIALVTLGCVMMRKCHLNTCPTGVATQDPELRKLFRGQPDHVVNFLTFIAEEVREIMAELGFRKFDDLIGRTDCLDVRRAVEHWKASGLDLEPILLRPASPPGIAVRRVEEQDHELEGALDYHLISLATDAIENRTHVVIDHGVQNTDRTVGTILGSEVTRKWGLEGLPPDTIRVNLTGSAGQSLGAFLPHGITLSVSGDANDYVGKGLCGGRIILSPPEGSTFKPDANIIIGNVVCYGATAGELFVNGMAGERFCVRNSGVSAVAEGIGDHGCEYMTGGRVVILGGTGRNFGAGMSGGFAYVFNESGEFERNCNMAMIELESVTDADDIAWLRERIELQRDLTGSARAAAILKNWEESLPQFVKVVPTEYRRALKEMAERKRNQKKPKAAEVSTGAEARNNG